MVHQGGDVLRQCVELGHDCALRTFPLGVLGAMQALQSAAPVLACIALLAAADASASTYRFLPARA